LNILEKLEITRPGSGLGAIKGAFQPQKRAKKCSEMPLIFVWIEHRKINYFFLSFTD